MKISVLVSPSEKHRIPRLRDFFSERFIASQFFLIDPNWTLSGEFSLLKVLMTSYDFLILCDQKELDSRWIPYVAGYSQERSKEVLRRINLTFFLTNINEPLGLWLKNFPVVHSYSALNRHVSQTEEVWHRQDDMLAANRFLEIIGFNTLNKPILLGDEEKDLMLLELYIERGGSPNHIDEKGVPLICDIIRKDETVLAAHLLQRNCDVNIISQDRGTTPIMDAASLGKDILVKQLIALGADINHASKEGQTALILAIGNRHYACAKVLLEAGAETEHKDSLGMTALKYARLYGFDELAAMLEENNNG